MDEWNWETWVPTYGSPITTGEGYYRGKIDSRDLIVLAYEPGAFGHVPEWVGKFICEGQIIPASRINPQDIPLGSLVPKENEYVVYTPIGTEIAHIDDCILFDGVSLYVLGAVPFHHYFKKYTGQVKQAPLDDQRLEFLEEQLKASMRETADALGTPEALAFAEQHLEKEEVKEDKKKKKKAAPKETSSKRGADGNYPAPKSALEDFVPGTPIKDPIPKDIITGWNTGLIRYTQKFPMLKDEDSFDDYEDFSQLAREAFEEDPICGEDPVQIVNTDGVFVAVEPEEEPKKEKKARFWFLKRNKKSG